MSSGSDIKKVKNHFDSIAKNYDGWKRQNIYYYSNLKNFLRNSIEPGAKVLEIGCATGEMLASVEPAVGVGIDISSEMIKIAQKKFPKYTFVCSPIENLQHDEKFDYIIMVDLLDHVYDIIELFECVHKFCHPTTKIIITMINPWWEPILKFMEKVGVKAPQGPHNFLEASNLTKIVDFLDFSIIYSGYMLLFPKFIPILSYLANTIGVTIWGLNKFSFVQYIVLRPIQKNNNNLELGCSVIVPCHNEEDNVEEAIKRVPSMGKKTEIIVVDDGSRDRTKEIVRNLQKDNSNLKLIDYGSNKGKGYAVQQGFNTASQGVIMILDADMSVPPEELPNFFNLLNKGACDFVNGTRMVYPMEKQAMRYLNNLGNKIFSLIMTFITGQYLTDTLCGTKALYKKDYQRITMGVDRWGDFDLLFGAVKIKSKIMEMPVHYMSRKSGESKMKTFRHGLHLLRACLRGFKDIVFRQK
ncbi:glycosyltransferase [Candidatus Omnitrophota bacterium]